MALSNGSIFRVTGPVWGELTDPRRIPLKKTSDAEHWFFILICTWTNISAINRDVGDLRGHRAHCSLSLMNLYLFVTHIKEDLTTLTWCPPNCTHVHNAAVSCAPWCSQSTKLKFQCEICIHAISTICLLISNATNYHGCSNDYVYSTMKVSYE